MRLFAYCVNALFSCISFVFGFAFAFKLNNAPATFLCCIVAIIFLASTVCILRIEEK